MRYKDAKRQGTRNKQTKGEDYDYYNTATRPEKEPTRVPIAQQRGLHPGQAVLEI